MKDYKKDCKRCKDSFIAPWHTQQYCEVCIEIRKREKLAKGVRRVRQCRGCTRDFKPDHHATKYCTRCKTKQKRPKKEIVAADLADYVYQKTDGLREIVDVHYNIMTNNVWTNPKGGRGKKSKHIPSTIDQIQRSATALKEIPLGRAPTGTLKAPKGDTFKPEFPDADYSTEGVGTIDEGVINGED